MSRRSFVKGALLLSGASLVCKALSALFKIPLDRYFIGPEGIGIYQSANTIFNWMLAVGATGIPIAVSNLVANSDEDEAAEIRASSLWLVTSLGSVVAVLLFIFAREVAGFIAASDAAPATLAIRVMSPGIALLGIISAYRGYFQGRGNMLPSAVSQISDSLCKVGIGLTMCALLLPHGVEVATAGAISGVTVGTLAGSIVMLIAGRRSIRVYKRPSLSTAKRVAMLAVPVTLGAAGFACVMLSDTLTVQNILVRMGMKLGESKAQFGYLSRAFMIYNLPATLISAVTMSVAPACAEAWKNNDKKLLRENSVSAVKLIMLISMPCMAGVVSFSKEILTLLYKSGEHNEPLMFMGALMVLIPFTQVLSGILQATGCVWKPIIILGVTVLVKTVLNFVFIPAIGIMGSTFATVIAYGISSVAFVYLFRRHMGFGFPAGAFLRPGVAAGIGAVCGRLVYKIVPGTDMGFILAAASMAVVYVLMALALGAVDLSGFKLKR